ncbi:MAG: glycosyltransferase family 2 protein [Bacteroidales bacterium]|nr:glycosyltransferase family 2 protein [Bacteroidales bacterium]
MIPTYNQPQYIDQCVKSAMDQDYPNLEIVISDDSTNDETENIIKQKYIQDPRIRYFHNEIRLGRVGNYHHTLYEKATGDYVLNLDGDDWLIDHTYIRRAVKMLEENDVVCVIARIQLFHEDSNKLEYGADYEGLDPVDEGNKYLSLVVHLNAPFNHMTVLYRRDEAIKTGFYTKDTMWTDSESIFRLVCNRKMAFINDYVGVWRIHGTNESKSFYGSLQIENIFSNDESVFEYCSKCEDGKYSVSTWIEMAKYQNTKRLIRYLLKSKKYDQILQFLQFMIKEHFIFFIKSLPKLLFYLIGVTFTSFCRKLKCQDFIYPRKEPK